MGNLNYDIDSVINYIQGLDAGTASIIQARAFARLTAIHIARDSSTFAIQPLYRRGRPESQGNIQSVLNVIDSLVVADAQDLRRIEAVSQRLSELDAESSSSSGSSSSSSGSSVSSQSTSSSSGTSSASSESSSLRSTSSSSATSSSSSGTSSASLSSSSSSSSSVSSQSLI